MGDPKKARKKWEGPSTPWSKEQLVREQELLGRYGLRNKKEIYIARTIVKNLRLQARSLLAIPPAERAAREKQLTAKIVRMGLLDKEELTVSDVLGLTEENLLERRLQTIVFRNGLSRTIYQARQLIVHGHVTVNGVRVTSPSYIVKKGDVVDYYPTSIFKTNPPVEVNKDVQ